VVVQTILNWSWISVFSGPATFVRRMKHRSLKIGFTSVVLVMAFTALLWSTLREGTEYYKHVDEVMSDPQRWEGKPLQLHGFVVPDSILRKRDSLVYKFKIQNRGSIIDATYTGIVPDTFKDSAEVVVKGRLSQGGFEVAPNGVMAKCPSKYEPSSGVSASVSAGP
jgi:cytochrome c-type biogenesis protein CcmE